MALEDIDFGWEPRALKFARKLKSRLQYWAGIAANVPLCDSNAKNIVKNYQGPLTYRENAIRKYHTWRQHENSQTQIWDS